MKQLEGLITITDHLELAEGERTYVGWQQWALTEKRKLATLPDLYHAGERCSGDVLRKLQQDFRNYTIVTGTCVNYTHAEIIHCDGTREYGFDYLPPNMKMVPIRATLRDTWFTFLLFCHKQWATPENIISPFESLTGLPAEKIKIKSGTRQSEGVVALRTLSNGDILIDLTYSPDKPGHAYIFAEEFHPFSSD